MKTNSLPAVSRHKKMIWGWWKNYIACCWVSARNIKIRTEAGAVFRRNLRKSPKFMETRKLASVGMFSFHFGASRKKSKVNETKIGTLSVGIAPLRALIMNFLLSVRGFYDFEKTTPVDIFWRCALAKQALTAELSFFVGKVNKTATCKGLLPAPMNYVTNWRVLITKKL